MAFIQTIFQTIWSSLLALGWIKLIIAILIIGVLSRVQPILGVLAVIFFVAYLLGWLM